MRIVFLLILMSFVFLSACKEDDALQNKHEEPYMKLSTRSEYEQATANKVKMHLNKREDLAKFHVVNDQDNILIAFDVHHLKRFSLGRIEHEIQREVDQLFKEYTITVSTDLKIILGLEKLEKQIHEGRISKDEISKELQRMIQLTKDEA